MQSSLSARDLLALVIGQEVIARVEAQFQAGELGEAVKRLEAQLALLAERPKQDPPKVT